MLYSFHHIINLFFYRAWLLSVVVEKSKKCVDFTFTLYFIDVIVCCFYEVRLAVASNVLSTVLLLTCSLFAVFISEHTI